MGARSTHRFRHSNGRGGCPKAHFGYTVLQRNGSSQAKHIKSTGPGGEIGRRKGLKILFRASGVRVQVPPRVPLTRNDPFLNARRSFASPAFGPVLSLVRSLSAS